MLRAMQPESGGYLEATPLTSFVLMSLAASGLTSAGSNNGSSNNGSSTEKQAAARTVSRNAMKFLVDSVRDDGSFPIDTNLATWVTSLSIEALSADPNDNGDWITDDLRRWHAECQTKVRHPYTGAEPGGWGWTDLTGSVPDGDDTPAAMLATKLLYRDGQASSAETCDAVLRVAVGADWLAGLQNRDGGYPTFCRGWGRLPFDRSSVDLTAHAIRALGEKSKGRIQGASARFDF